MKIVGSNQNCQLNRTRLNTVLSHVYFLGWPSRVAACSLCFSVRYQASRCDGRPGIKTHPEGLSEQKFLEIISVLTKDSHGNRDDRNNNENPSPSRESILSIKRCHKPGLNPATSHTSQVSETDKHRCPRSKLRFLIPRSIYEMRTNTSPNQHRNSQYRRKTRNLLCDSRKPSFKSIKQNNLPNVIHLKRDQRQDTPRQIRSNKDVFRRRNSQ
jgi:hypothetical protein